MWFFEGLYHINSKMLVESLFRKFGLYVFFGWNLAIKKPLSFGTNIDKKESILDKVG